MQQIIFSSDEQLKHAKYDGSTRVFVSGDAVTANGINHIISWPITFLSLAGCGQMNDEAMRLVAKMQTLVGLDLESCAFITDPAIEYLSSLTSLETLSVRSCYDLTDASCRVFGSLHLWSLDLQGCSKITDAGVIALAKSQTLENLTLPYFSQIGDAGLTALATGQLRLKSLEIGRLPNVTRIGIEAIASITTLEHIRLYSLPHVSAMDLEALRKRLPAVNIEAG